MTLNFPRQEIENRIKEKCEEYELSKKNQQRLIDSLQASLEAESKSKGEVLRAKKKLEVDIQELEVALDQISRVISLIVLHKANFCGDFCGFSKNSNIIQAQSETMANCRRQQSEMRELRQTIEECREDQECLRDKLLQAEKKAASAFNEVEEAKTMHEMLERQKRQIVLELDESKDALEDVKSDYNSLMTAKRSLESELCSCRAEMEEMSFALRNSQEKAKQAALDVLRLIRLYCFLVNDV